MITWFVRGTPVAKERPRFNTFTRHAYTPSATKKWEDYVRWQSKEYRPKKPFKGPLVVFITFYLKRPKSIKDSVIHCIGRKDVDNFAKSILDALHDSYFKNDNQVVFLGAYKCYGKIEGVKISIQTVKQDNDLIFISHCLTEHACIVPVDFNT